MRPALLLTAALLAALAPAARAAELPPDFFGVYSEDALETRGTARAATLQGQRQTGFGIVRLPFDWSTIQPDPDRWRWEAHDEFVLDAARAGMRILPVLVQSPGWARVPERSEAAGIWPPQFPDYIADFASEAVRRYGSGGTLWQANPDVRAVPIRSWQVWNEPNLEAWWPSGPDPGEYVALLRSAALAIRSVDPAAEVVAAGLPINHEEPPDRFLARMYDAGAAQWMDTVASHPYGTVPADSIERVEEIAAVVAANGGREPVWATEFGWATAGTYGWVTDEGGQAERLRATVTALTARRAELRLRGLATYSWRDGDGRAWMANAGLRRFDNSPKPSLFAMRDTIRGLSPPPAAAEARDAPAASQEEATPAAGDASAAPVARWSLRLFGRRKLRPGRDGRVALAVRCAPPAEVFCLGSVWVERPVAAGRAARPSQLGSARFRLRPGAVGRVRLRLNAAARRMLRRRGRLGIVVRAAGTDVWARDAEAGLRRTLTRGALR